MGRKTQNRQTNKRYRKDQAVAKRTYVFGEKNKTVEIICKPCIPCLTCAQPTCNPREPLQMTELSQGPWTNVSVDSADYVLVVTDDYSSDEVSKQRMILYTDYRSNSKLSIWSRATLYSYALGNNFQYRSNINPRMSWKAKNHSDSKA